MFDDLDAAISWHPTNSIGALEPTNVDNDYSKTTHILGILTVARFFAGAWI